MDESDSPPEGSEAALLEAPKGVQSQPDGRTISFDQSYLRILGLAGAAEGADTFCASEMCALINIRKSTESNFFIVCLLLSLNFLAALARDKQSLQPGSQSLHFTDHYFLIGVGSSTILTSVSNFR